MAMTSIGLTSSRRTGVEGRDLGALKAIRSGPMRVHQPSPERIQRLADFGFVKMKNGMPKLTLRGRIAIWREKHKQY
jgi:hypothetical protein